MDRIVSGELFLSDFLARGGETDAQPSKSDVIDADPIPSMWPAK
jgi:hypothetical protein